MQDLLGPMQDLLGLYPKDNGAPLKGFKLVSYHRSQKQYDHSKAQLVNVCTVHFPKAGFR